MPSVIFLQYFVLFLDEDTSKILQDLGKYCFAVSLLLHMYVYGTIDENIVFSFKILLFFQP